MYLPFVTGSGESLRLCVLCTRFGPEVGVVPLAKPVVFGWFAAAGLLSPYFCMSFYANRTPIDDECDDG